MPDGCSTGPPALSPPSSTLSATGLQRHCSRKALARSGARGRRRRRAAGALGEPRKLQTVSCSPALCIGISRSARDRPVLNRACASPARSSASTSTSNPTSTPTTTNPRTATRPTSRTPCSANSRSGPSPAPVVLGQVAGGRRAIAMRQKQSRGGRSTVLSQGTKSGRGPSNASDARFRRDGEARQTVAGALDRGGRRRPRVCRGRGAESLCARAQARFRRAAGRRTPA
jgi:hypothetical protein